MSDEIVSYSIDQILQYQQNRYPMLFIDHVTKCEPGRYALGYKLFSINEWYFHGYDTDAPKVWNAIQLEAMSQMLLMSFITLDECKGMKAMSNKFDKVNFRRKIEPGDRLNLEAELLSFRRGIAKGKVRGFIGSELACDMECTIVVPELMIGAMLKSAPAETQVPVTFEFENSSDFGIARIQDCLLNKYPWLLIDRAINVDPGKFVRAIKNFTYNEHFFPSHFADSPSVPGFIQVETCMQAFLLTHLSMEKYRKMETADRSLSDVKLQRKIIPGETLIVEATLLSLKRGVAKGRIESFVNGEPAISFSVTSIIVPEFNNYMLRR
jgi:3-hydroxyacyl-[acyl-carrier-protein] dehydratase